jgi:hypothetical protein
MAECTDKRTNQQSEPNIHEVSRLSSLTQVSRMTKSRRFLHFIVWSCVTTALFIGFQNFGPTPDDSIQSEAARSAEVSAEKTGKLASFIPHYIYVERMRDPASTKAPSWYIPPSKMGYKSSSEDIPDEEWIKSTEHKFFFTFNANEDNSTKSANSPAGQIVGPNGVVNDGKNSPLAPKKDEITWQVVDREGKGKIQYYGPVKMEAEYNIGTGESIVKVLQPLTKTSQMSVEANSKESTGTLNYHLTW